MTMPIILEGRFCGHQPMEGMENIFPLEELNFFILHVIVPFFHIFLIVICIFLLPKGTLVDVLCSIENAKKFAIKILFFSE